MRKEILKRGGRVESQKGGEIISRNFDDVPPVAVSGGSYVRFVLDNHLYYFQFDENMFFEHFYQKSVINDGKASKDVYLTELPRELTNPIDLGLDKNAKEHAIKILDYLVGANCSETYRKKHRVKVSNTYNNGYHYETTYAPMRYETIDF